MEGHIRNIDEWTYEGKLKIHILVYDLKCELVGASENCSVIKQKCIRKKDTNEVSAYALSRVAPQEMITLLSQQYICRDRSFFIPKIQKLPVVVLCILFRNYRQNTINQTIFEKGCVRRKR